jgi:hypothetical protein
VRGFAKGPISEGAVERKRDWGEWTSHFLYLTPGRAAKQETKPALFCHKTGRTQPKHKNIGGRRRMQLQIPAHTVILELLL